MSKFNTISSELNTLKNNIRSIIPPHIEKALKDLFHLNRLDAVNKDKNGLWCKNFIPPHKKKKVNTKGKRMCIKKRDFPRVSIKELVEFKFAEWPFIFKSISNGIDPRNPIARRTLQIVIM